MVREQGIENLREKAPKFTKIIRNAAYELRQFQLLPALLFKECACRVKPEKMTEMAEQSKYIYIADDDDNIRKIVRAFLESEGYRVEDFPDGDLMLERFQQMPADLVILDVMMPGSDGFAICTALRKISTVPIIMLTARDTENDFALGLGLGSDDYIVKPFSAMTLLMRVKAIFRRIDFEREKHSEEPPRSIMAGKLLLNEDKRCISCEDRILALTPTEYEVLRYLMLKKDQAVSREDLLCKVWGFESAVETRATDDTVRRLRKKLDGCGVVISAVWG